MIVKEIMTKEVKTCRIWDDLASAAQVMSEHGCGAVPVLDESSKVVGMLTDRDICLTAYVHDRPLRDLEVRRAMSTNVWSCTPSDSLATAERTMEKGRVRRLPVIDGEGRLVGIISLHDIAREALAEQKCLRREVTEGEVGRILARLCRPRPPGRREEAPPPLAASPGT